MFRFWAAAGWATWRLGGWLCELSGRLDDRATRRNRAL